MDACVRRTMQRQPTRCGLAGDRRSTTRAALGLGVWMERDISRAVTERRLRAAVSRSRGAAARAVTATGRERHRRVRCGGAADGDECGDSEVERCIEGEPWAAEAEKRDGKAKEVDRNLTPAAMLRDSRAGEDIEPLTCPLTCRSRHCGAPRAISRWRGAFTPAQRRSVQTVRDAGNGATGRRNPPEAARRHHAKAGSTRDSAARSRATFAEAYTSRALALGSAQRTDTHRPRDWHRTAGEESTEASFRFVACGGFGDRTATRRRE